MQLRLNGTIVATVANITTNSIINQAVSTATAAPVAGENILQIERTSGTANGWIGIDWVQLELNPTARRDADGDGLTEIQEEENGLNDAVASDAMLDHDGDGLTAAQEIARGT